MKSETLFIISTTFIALLCDAAETTCIPCYTCSSATHPGCEDPFTMVDPTSVAKSCYTKKCYKNVEKSGATTIVTRGCAASTHLTGCSSNSQGTTCFCESDNCNVSGRVLPNSLLAVTMGTVTILLRRAISN
ncbi:protein quiver [Lingula anatina]|uniref:Protein quiver n=1 Tax=Lingula anatina TaxID=7574 RepID=A0A1S3JVX1_LINAN|nr:protein quiver [Lingula anatina]|eukprot:XP_013414555.1 protein quiver [Lingula anatina]